MVITFHFTDDRQHLSYAETLEMIENHKYLMDCVNDPEAHMVGGRLWARPLLILFHCSGDVAQLGEHLLDV